MIRVSELIVGFIALLIWGPWIYCIVIGLVQFFRSPFGYTPDYTCERATIRTIDQSMED